MTNELTFENVWRRLAEKSRVSRIGSWLRILRNQLATKCTMTDSTEIATIPKSTKSRYPNSSVQSQIRLKSQFEFVRDTEESELHDLVDFGVVSFSVETVK